MERRNRNLIAILLTIVMVAAECSTVFAASAQGTPAKKAPQILRTSGDGVVDGYYVTCDMQYRTSPGYYYYRGPSWTVQDLNGSVDCIVSENSYKYNGKSYGSVYDLYDAGIKPGDKVDIDIVLTVKEPGSLVSPTGSGSNENVHYGTIKDVEMKKGKVTKENFRQISTFYISVTSLSFVENRSIPWEIFGCSCIPYLILTDKGVEKLKASKHNEDQILYPYEDFDLKIDRVNQGGKQRDVDITDCFDIDLTGVTVTFLVQGTAYVCTDVDEIRMGTKAGEFRKILKDHAYYEEDGKVVESWNSDDMGIAEVSYTTAGGNYHEIDYNDDAAIEEALATEGNTITVGAVSSKDELTWEAPPFSYWRFTVRKNSYRLVIEPFKEVASATGASSERTKHDFMLNVYAVKNETEKIRVGSLGDGERFRVNYIINNRPLRGTEKQQFFENIRPGDRLDYSLKWYIPSDERYLKHRSFLWDYGLIGYRKFSIDHINFFEYGGSESEDPILIPISSNYADPYSDAHRTDGYDVEELAADAAPYEFDVFRSTTAIGAVPVKISQKFSKYVSMNEFDPFANHRFTTDNKKIAIVDKKGYLVPKKRGRINIFLEQKTEDGGWIRIGDPIEMYVQIPVMKKKVFVSTGEEIFAHTFISRTTFAPNRWISTKPSVATIDEKTGKITPISSGTTKIIAVYGDPNDRKKNSKKKYKTTLRVN